MAGSLKQGTTTACVTSGGSISNGAALIANAVANLVNSTNLDRTVTARLVAAAGTTPAQGTTVALYLVPVSDGSTGGGVDTATPFFNPSYLAGYFVWPPASSATSQKMDIDGIPLSALDYIPYLVNNLGQTLSSGWTLTFYGTN
jgi:hypothetical protein